MKNRKLCLTKINGSIQKTQPYWLWQGNPIFQSIYNIHICSGLAFPTPMPSLTRELTDTFAKPYLSRCKPKFRLELTSLSLETNWWDKSITDFCSVLTINLDIPLDRKVGLYENYIYGMSILVSIAYRGMVRSGQALIEHPAAFYILVSFAFIDIHTNIAQKSHRNMLHIVAYILCLYVTVIE